jgi:hypothetical protein
MDRCVNRYISNRDSDLCSNLVFLFGDHIGDMIQENSNFSSLNYKRSMIFFRIQL